MIDAQSHDRQRQERPNGPKSLKRIEKERLALDCLPLVRQVALRLASRLPAHVELTDLIQAGFLGLLDALQKFDRDRGVRFRTYAELRIRGAILDSLRDLDWVPRSVRRRNREIETALLGLETLLGRPPTEEELARELQVGPLKLRQLLDDWRASDSANRQLEVSESDPQAIAATGRDPEELLEQLEFHALLVAAIERLTEREQLLLTLYYHEELTMKEVGEVLGVNESRVSQIHSKLIRRLRSRLDRGLAPPPSRPRACHRQAS